MTLRSEPSRSIQAETEVVLRQQLVDSFHDDRVHASFEKIFADIPAHLRNANPAGQQFTLWGLLVHIRLCVIDFLDACRIPGYVEPPVPEGFWPDENAVADDAAWEEDLAGYHAACASSRHCYWIPRLTCFRPSRAATAATFCARP
jgi:hypothetical protein